jgi:hypothetical protein
MWKDGGGTGITRAKLPSLQAARSMDFTRSTP